MIEDISLTPDIEFALLHFLLEFRDDFFLSISHFPSLRRNLLAAASYSFRSHDGRPFRDLLAPPLPTDPIALRRYQKPGPSFVILPDPDRLGSFKAGDCLELAVSFWGRGIQLLSDFSLVLQDLGRVGFHEGKGLFNLVTIEAEDVSGMRVPIWREGLALRLLAPPVNELRWWVQCHNRPTSLLLKFVTPARLLSQGKPLFTVDFRRLFPFVLRRVTSMLYAHCGRDVIGDPAPLLSAAGEVITEKNELRWMDWRVLETSGRLQDLGGITGSVRIAGDSLDVLLNVLRVGTLMNLGKGAAFGGGRYRIEE